MVLCATDRQTHSLSQPQQQKRTMAQGTSGEKLCCGNSAASSACVAAASGPPNALRSAASASSCWFNLGWGGVGWGAGMCLRLTKIYPST